MAIRKFKINIEGKTFVAEVEELGGAPATAPASKPVAPAAAPVAPASGNAIVSPMPGKIISIMVKKGQQIKNGEIGGMLADGPLGPARKAKKGAVVMARDTQVPLIPILWSADRCWLLNTWDRYMIPKPFARIVFYYAKPIWVPRFSSVEDLESFRTVLENSLNEGTSWCDAHFGPERPWRKVKEGGGVPEVGPLDKEAVP